MRSSYYTSNDYNSHVKNLERMTSTIDGPCFPNMFNRKAALPEDASRDKPTAVGAMAPDYHTHFLNLRKMSTYNGSRFPNLFGNRDKAAAEYASKGVDASAENYIRRKHQTMEDSEKKMVMND